MTAIGRAWLASGWERKLANSGNPRLLGLSCGGPAYSKEQATSSFSLRGEQPRHHGLADDERPIVVHEHAALADEVAVEVSHDHVIDFGLRTLLHGLYFHAAGQAVQNVSR